MTLKEAKANLTKAQEAYSKSKSSEDKIAVLEAENELLKLQKAPSESPNVGSEIGEAIKSALKSKDLPPMRPVKALMGNIITCDEVIVERSEKDKSLVVVEVLRKNVKISKRTFDIMNKSVLTQSRCKAYIVKGKKADSLIK